ncbi:MAG: MBL fold metallo-hydrolase [Candidatus Parcubacteria bacterium]|nr:MBL fold metallo-hydrolase [Candidatus Parcubacteria bacterium]
MEKKRNGLEVTFYGTRGSVPIANRDSVQTGGNTTCLRVNSPCLPEGWWLVIDAGSGFVPLCSDALKSGVKAVIELFTHYHHDHTQGIGLGALTYMKHIPINCWGPVDGGLGPREVFEHIMKHPFFPVDFSQVSSHFTCHKLEHPNTQVLLIHPEGGIKQMAVDQFERADGKPLSIGKDGRKYPKSECLVIRMLYSNHPERTIAYRFEDGPTGKVFVFLTDHENQAGLPNDLKALLKDADLVVMDCQYPENKYRTQTSGFGHGTAQYCVKTALQVGAKSLGLTHHDPPATDTAINAILAEAKATYGEQVKSLDPKAEVVVLTPEKIFVCQDYLKVQL